MTPGEREYSLRYLGDPVLVARCRSLGDDELPPARLLDAMREVCRKWNGAGLAANQVGGLERVILAKVAGKLVAMINPSISARSAETHHITEGCLSLPDFFIAKRRHRAITVRYRSEEGDTTSVQLRGVEAQCVQHEIEHLDGMLIVDGLPRQQRRRAERLVFAHLARRA